MSGNAAQIRSCQSEDLAQVLTILKQSPEAASWSEGTLREELAGNPRHFLIASQRQQIVGFISGRQIHDEGEILNLAVLQPVRRKGVATALVKRLLDLFAQEGVVRVFLEVRRSNAGASAFYKALGFRQIGERPNYYRDPGEDALVLAAQLPLPNSPSTIRTL